MAINQTLAGCFPVTGRVEWIGLRPERRQAMRAVQTVRLIAGRGLEGDHRAQTGGGQRQVTLIQYENLETIRRFMQLDAVTPEMLRRNVLISGVNLVALIDREFHVGEALLLGTGHCNPCARMEETLGYGGYNAMRGYGGINAIVRESGEIAVGDVIAGAPREAPA